MGRHRSHIQALVAAQHHTKEKRFVPVAQSPTKNDAPWALHVALRDGVLLLKHRDGFAHQRLVVTNGEVPVWLLISIAINSFIH